MAGRSALVWLIKPTSEGEPMDIFEIEREETVSREEVARRLRLLADMLARENDLEFDRGGMHFKVDVPGEVRLKVEPRWRPTSASWRSS